MSKAMRQMSAPAERSGEASGEAGRQLGSDEADGPRHEDKSTGTGLLTAALTRENLQQAWKRVKLKFLVRFPCDLIRSYSI